MSRVVVGRERRNGGLVASGAGRDPHEQRRVEAADSSGGRYWRGSVEGARRYAGGAGTAAGKRRARVVTEHAATFSPLPGVERWRPPQGSPLRNLLVAGDWTATGWPATMEGAVPNGYLAAEALLHRQGVPAALVQPDLS
jgi:hypothetical protein